MPDYGAIISQDNMHGKGGDALPDLIDRATSALSSARDSAEVLEARDMARVAYDAAKSAGRMARAKKAHETVISAVYRAQADALLIEARAKMRLADEYDAAQERGEVAKLGDNLPSVDASNAKPTAADLGLRRDEIHEARKLRNAEAQEPGATQAALSAMVERGEEPTKAKLRQDLKPVDEKAKDDAAPDPDAKLRAEYRKLTDEARESDWIEMRKEVEESRKRIKAQRSEIADLKGHIKELSEKDDAHRKLAAKHKQLLAANYARDEAIKNAKRFEYKMKKAQEELAKITGQEIEL